MNIKSEQAHFWANPSVSGDIRRALKRANTWLAPFRKSGYRTKIRWVDGGYLAYAEKED